MKLIPLTQGKYALVDDWDFAWLSRFKWHAERGEGSRTFYAATNWNRGGTRRTIRMHQLLLPTVPRVDHVNRNGLFNSRSNLRAASCSQNAGNMAKWSRVCTSSYKGVSWHSQRRRWKVSIGDKYAGIFSSEIEAARAYDKLALKLFGAFARLNFPSGKTLLSPNAVSKQQ